MNTDIKGFFAIGTEKKSRCTLCQKEVHGKTSNRKRHLERLHNHVFVEIKRKWNGIEEKAKERAVSSKTANQVWTVESFKRLIMKLVVYGGMPLCHFMNPEFSEFYGDVAKVLDICLRQHSIKLLILNYYGKKKKELVELLKGQYIFLKVDHTKMNGRIFMALNCQLLDEKLKEIVIYTLGAEPVICSQTGAAVKKFIQQKMKEFEIENHQVLSIVSDCARNLICVTSLPSDDISSNKQSDDDSTEQLNKEEIEIEDAIKSRIEECSSDFVMQHTTCPGHLFHSCLKEAMLESGADRYITISNRLTKAAKTAAVKEALDAVGCPLERSQHNIRWKNEFDVLDRVVESKCHFQSLEQLFPELHVSDDEWKEMQGVLSVINPAVVFAKKLQEKTMTPGKFYFNWCSLSLTLKYLSTQHDKGSCPSRFCQKLLEKMLDRVTVLLKNKILAAGIFVDPQYRDSLNEDQLPFAKEAFKEIALHMEEKRPKKKKSEHQQSNSSSFSVSLPSSTISGVELWRHINQLDNTKNRTSPQPSLDDHQLRPYEAIVTDCIEKMNAFAPSSTLLESLWQYPVETRKTALIVSAFPTSHASVERLLAALKIIHHPVNTTHSADVLKAITFLRSNSC